MSEILLEDRVEHLEKRIRRMEIVNLGMFCVMLFVVSLLGISQSKLGMAFGELLEAQVQSTQRQIDGNH